MTMYHRARFTAELEGEDLIVVVDRNLPNTRSVNDIEAVVRTIANYVTIGQRMMIYCDSDGRWDGVVLRRLVNRVEFLGFHPIGARTREEAIARARQKIG